MRIKFQGGILDGDHWCPNWLYDIGQNVQLLWILVSLCIKQKLILVFKIPFTFKRPWCYNLTVNYIPLHKPDEVEKL